MNPLIKYGIMAVLAALSGFFLAGFSVLTVIAAFSFKKSPTKLWGSLVGIGLNGIVFLLTFPAVYPMVLQAINKVLFKFR
jgi:hypothetical protein